MEEMMPETPKTAAPECPYPGQANVVGAILVDEILAALTWENVLHAAMAISKVRGAAERLAREWKPPEEKPVPGK